MLLGLLGLVGLPGFVELKVCVWRGLGLQVSGLGIRFKGV